MTVTMGLAAMILLLLLPPGIVTTQTIDQPNIILMNMDDMGWGDLGVTGHPSKETPQLDKMAEEGVLFTDFYTSAAICSPSRASLLTGRLPLRNGFYQSTYPGRNAYTPQDIVGGIADSEILIPELLAEAGYRTKLIGKWHLGHRPEFLPTRHGFQEWFGAPNCHFIYEKSRRPGPNIPVYRDGSMVGRYYEEFPIDVARGVANYTGLLLQEAIDYIAREEDSPLFLYWAPDSTHGPWYSGRDFRGSSARGSTYGDAMKELDWAIGKILDQVRQGTGPRDTLVVFTSDNGADLNARERGGSSGPLLCGKQTTFEGGMRTPTIAWWKNSPLRLVSRQAASHMDWLPTFVELAGATLPSGLTLDGVSLAPFLLGRSSLEEKPVFFYRGNLLYAVRVGQYKGHYYTWTTGEKELSKGIDLCPGVNIQNVTTTDIRSHLAEPVVFHLGRDPGERFPVHQNTLEYQRARQELDEVRASHMAGMVAAVPVLNWCDVSVMNWAPPGCEAVRKCQDVPKSQPKLCYWPH